MSDVNVIGGKASGSANEVVLDVFNVGKINVLVVVVLVTGHG